MSSLHLLVFATGLSEDEGVKWFVTTHPHLPGSWPGTQLSSKGRRKSSRSPDISYSLLSLCFLTSKAPSGFKIKASPPLPPLPPRSVTCHSPYLRIQFHDMSHLIPAKAHKPPVILRAVPSHDNVRLEIGLPLDPVRRGGGPPLGEVCGRMAFCPDVVPGTHGEKPLNAKKEAELSKCRRFRGGRGMC